MLGIIKKPNPEFKKMTIDWSKISPDRFEQLCTDIIRSEGFYNIRRMGGSGDRGRDIVAQKQTQ